MKRGGDFIKRKRKQSFLTFYLLYGTFVWKVHRTPLQENVHVKIGI